MTTHIQALILSKDFLNRRQAESWIRRHPRFKVMKTDEKPKTYRFRLRTPDETRYEYKIKPFTDGVKAVIGVPFYQMY